MLFVSKFRRKFTKKLSCLAVRKPAAQPIAKHRLIYIAHPLSSDAISSFAANVGKVHGICRQMARNSTLIPIAPYLQTIKWLDDNKQTERELGMLMNRPIVERCDELQLWGHKISAGMLIELRWAAAAGVKITAMTKQTRQQLEQLQLVDEDRPVMQPVISRQRLVGVKTIWRRETKMLYWDQGYKIPDIATAND